MRHSVRMTTTVKINGHDENKLTVFEIEDFVNLEQELRRHTQLLRAKYQIVDQSVAIRKMRTSY